MSHFETIQILKKSIKLFTLCIVFNLSSLAFAQTPQALQTENLETYPREVLEAEKAIWKIYNKNSAGTGFFIGQKLFVTNYHVLYSLLKNEITLDEIHLSQEGNPNTLNIKQVISVSALDDLAIIEIKETSQHYLKLSQTNAKADDDLFITGYPDKVFTRMKKTGQINYEEDDYFFSFPVNHSNIFGASGSPVLNNQGQVFGVASQSVVNMMYLIKINHLNLTKGDTGQNCETMSIKNCLKKEIKNLTRLAEQGNAFAQFHLGLIDDNEKETKYWYEKAGSQGFAPAQYYLGFTYYYGFRVPQNDELAEEWYLKAAMQGFAPAQNNLAAMYKYELAEEWYLKAAMQGFAPAQFNLGAMYYSGKETKQNYELAEEWFQKAADQGVARAQFYLTLIYKNRVQDKIKKRNPQDYRP